jgi:hypothetical protein
MTTWSEGGRVSWVAVILVVLVLSGCGGRSRSPFRAGGGNEAIRIEVRNDNFLDVTVYVLPDGVSHRIGDVTGSSSATLDVPARLIFAATSMRLLVNPIGSREAYLSEEILVSHGDLIRLHVASQIQMSSWSVR